MTIETRVVLGGYNKEPSNAVNDTDVFSVKAKVVMEMINRWGMIAGEPDGEDSAGRAKLKLIKAERLVDRALSIADLMFDEFEDRGWLIQSATFEDMDILKENVIKESEQR